MDPRLNTFLEALWGEENFEAFLAIHNLKRNALPVYARFNKNFEKEIHNKILKHVYKQMPNFPEKIFRLIDIHPMRQIKTRLISVVYSAISSLITVIKSQGFTDLDLENYVNETIRVKRLFWMSFSDSVPNTRRVITSEVFDPIKKVTKCLRLEMIIGSDKIDTFETNVRISWDLKIFEYTDLTDIVDLMMEPFWDHSIDYDDDDD